jgi:hypothetical protein
VQAAGLERAPDDDDEAAEEGDDGGVEAGLEERPAGAVNWLNMSWTGEI